MKGGCVRRLLFSSRHLIYLLIFRNIDRSPKSPRKQRAGVYEALPIPHIFYRFVSAVPLNFQPLNGSFSRVGFSAGEHAHTTLGETNLNLNGRVLPSVVWFACCACVPRWVHAAPPPVMHAFLRLGPLRLLIFAFGALASNYNATRTSTTVAEPAAGDDDISSNVRTTPFRKTQASLRET